MYLFPGMDPYLEDATLWTGIHASTIVYIRNYLQPLLQPRYIAAVEERVYLEGPDTQRIPDVWVTRKKPCCASKKPFEPASYLKSLSILTACCGILTPFTPRTRIS